MFQSKKKPYYYKGNNGSVVWVMPSGVELHGYDENYNTDPHFKSVPHYMVWSYSYWGKKIVRSVSWKVKKSLSRLLVPLP